MATNQTPQQPVIPPAGDPNAQYGPAPIEQNTAYQQQPVNQQYFAQPQAAPVQYVVMAESLKGVKGWLLFFVLCFGLASISYVGTFFGAMNDLSEATNVVTLIFAPILAILSVITVVMISLEKRLGKWMAVASFGVAALYGAINVIVGFATDGGNVTMLLSGVIIALLLQALVALYFFTSRRVKETLIK